jgi:hypothetical protein
MLHRLPPRTRSAPHAARRRRSPASLLAVPSTPAAPPARPPPPKRPCWPGHAPRGRASRAAAGADQPEAARRRRHRQRPPVVTPPRQVHIRAEDSRRRPSAPHMRVTNGRCPHGPVPGGPAETPGHRGYRSDDSNSTAKLRKATRVRGSLPPRASVISSRGPAEGKACLEGALCADDDELMMMMN